MNFFYEKDEPKEEPKPIPVKPVLPIELPPLGARTFQPCVAHSQTSAGSKHFYDILVAKTDPSLVPTLKKVYSVAQTLEHVIPDSALRMRAAVAAASVDVSSVSAEVQKLSDLLKQEASGFQRELATKIQSIDSRKDTADAMEKQLQALRSEIAQDSQKVKTNEEDFGTALKQREEELAKLAQESSTWR